LKIPQSNNIIGVSKIDIKEWTLDALFY